MVKYTPSDVIGIGEFEFAWRLTDPRWSVLPDELLRRILPLSDERSRELVDRFPCFKRYPYPFDYERYHVTRDTSLEAPCPDDDERHRKWFSDLPINAREGVYVCWNVVGGAAVITNWGTFVAAWDDFWYPFDMLFVFDESMDWGVICGPEEFAVFGERGPVDPDLPLSDPAYGLGLIRIVMD